MSPRKIQGTREPGNQGTSGGKLEEGTKVVHMTARFLVSSVLQRECTG